MNIGQTHEQEKRVKCFLEHVKNSFGKTSQSFYCISEINREIYNFLAKNSTKIVPENVEPSFWAKSKNSHSKSERSSEVGEFFSKWSNKIPCDA